MYIFFRAISGRDRATFASTSIFEQWYHLYIIVIATTSKASTLLGSWFGIWNTQNQRICSELSLSIEMVIDDLIILLGNFVGNFGLMKLQIFK